MYRNGLDWTRTIFRGFPVDRDVYDEENNRKWEANWSKTLPQVAAARKDDRALNVVEMRILGWITAMEGYLTLRELGVPTCAARFEDLTSQSVPILKQFFSFCEIDSIDWLAINEVLSCDSQAGTAYDRKNRYSQNRELTEDLIQDLLKVVASRPLLRTPDVILPGTLVIDS